MLQRLILIILAGFSTVTQASEYQVVQKNWIRDAQYVRAIDPILSSSQRLLGLVCMKPDRLEVILNDRDSLVSIVINPDLNEFHYPESMVSRMAGDTLIVYIDYDLLSLWGDSIHIQQVRLIDNTVLFDTAHFAAPTFSPYRYLEPHRQKVGFRHNPSGVPTHLVVEIYLTCYDFSGVSEWTRADLASTRVLDLSSLALLESFPYPTVQPGTFGPQSGRQYAAFGMHYYDYQEPLGSTYCKFSSMQLLDSSGHTTYQIDFEYGNQWLAVGDVSSSHPYDEVLYYGDNAGLDSAYSPSVWNLSCYNFSSSDPEMVWRLPIENIEPEYLFADTALMAWRGDSALLFINAAGGYIFDSTVLPFAPTVRKAFSCWDESPLHAAVVVGDTAMILQFDAIVDVPVHPNRLPIAFSLSQNYPNPFNATTEIRFSLPQAGEVSMDIYDLLGRKVRTLASDKFTAGEHRLRWDGRDNSGTDCATGVYLYRLQAGESSQSRKMLLLK